MESYRLEWGGGYSVFHRKDPLPDPAEAVQVPEHMRLRFQGKMAAPTTVLSPEERRAAMEAAGARKPSRFKRFLGGLLFGALLIVAMDLGGEQLLRFLPDRVRFDPPIPLRALVFVGMSAGVLIAALLTFLVLGLQAAGWVLRGKGSLFGAVARGVGRLVSATTALGLTLGAFAGTGWFMIPREDWGRTRDYLERKARDGSRELLQKIAPSPERK
jgi:hypothetical protein